MKLPIPIYKYFRKQSSFWKTIIPARHYCGGIICFLILLVICTAGCGKKGLPLPPLEEIPPGVTDLTAERNGLMLTLSWSIPEGKNAGLITGYKIYRSTAPLQLMDCRGCPVTFRLLEDVPVSESNPNASGNRKMFFSKLLELYEPETENPEAAESADHQPAEMENRKIVIEYQYKVVGYTEYNVRSPDSNVITVNHPVKMETAPTKGNREE